MVIVWRHKSRSGNRVSPVGTSAVDELLRNYLRAFPGRFHFLSGVLVAADRLVALDHPEDLRPHLRMTDRRCYSTRKQDVARQGGGFNAGMAQPELGAVLSRGLIARLRLSQTGTVSVADARCRHCCHTRHHKHSPEISMLTSVPPVHGAPTPV